VGKDTGEKADGFSLRDLSPKKGFAATGLTIDIFVTALHCRLLT
jgi:hypothetical protein